MAIDIYSKYGNVRQLASQGPRAGLAAEGNSHGLSAQQVEALHLRLDRYEGGLIKAGSANTAMDAIADILPKYGQATSPVTQGPGTFFSQQTKYDARYSTPDRTMYPHERKKANSIARLFYRRDPTVGAVLDLFSELPWSDFQLTGEGIEGEVKDGYETMILNTGLRSLFPFLVKEFFVIGEVAAHAHWDDDAGMWAHISLLNPDHINVLYSPMVNMEPIVEFEPDHVLKAICNSTHPLLRQLREAMPSEVVNRVVSGQNILLSPTNFSFIARRMHPYDMRGTSILTRLFQTFMLEDAIANATIATARRCSSPLKIAKHGDPATGYIPPPEVEQRMQRLIAQAELDPMSWISWNYAVQFELVGIQERVMPYTQYYPLLEGIKLLALGVSKAFVTGDANYNSAAAGLTVFLQRLKALREMFINQWVTPKIFGVMAKANNWVKPTEAELSHRVRVKRSQREILEGDRLLIPKIRWEKPLDPSVDADRANIINQLEQAGGGLFKVPKSTKYATAGLSYEEQLKQFKTDRDLEKRILGNDMELAAAAGVQLPGMPAPTTGDTGGGGGGGAGAVMSPGLPPDTFGAFSDSGAPPLEGGPPPSDMGALPPEGGPGTEAPGPAPGPTPAPASADRAASPDSPGNVSGSTSSETHWPREALHSATRLFATFDDAEAADVEPWARALEDIEVKRALTTHDPQLLWDALETWMMSEGYPAKAILQLQDSLKQTALVKPDVMNLESRLLKLSDMFGDSSNSDFFTGFTGSQRGKNPRK